MTRQRILHLINTAGPGGAETVFLELATRFSTDKWFSIAVVPEVDWLTRQLRNTGTHVVVDGAKQLLDFGYFRRMVELIRREGVDVIHAHLFGPTVEAAFLSVITSVPVIATIHGTGDLSPEERLKWLKFAAVRRGVDRLVFVSDSLREHFLAVAPLDRRRTAVIPNGVDLARHLISSDRFAVRQEFGIPAEAFVVGAVGNLRPVKRYDLFLRAAALLYERDPRYRFLVVGQATEPLFGELLALRSNLGLDSVVHFTDFRSDVEQLLSTFDLYCISSDSEGFSIATVQALASGKPVVATRCGGPEEILEHGKTGYLVPTGSAVAIASAIERLREDPALRNTLGDRGQAMVSERYSISTQTGRYERLYDEVIAEKTRGPGKLSADPRSRVAGSGSISSANPNLFGS